MKRRNRVLQLHRQKRCKPKASATAANPDTSDKLESRKTGIGRCKSKNPHERHDTRMLKEQNLIDGRTTDILNERLLGDGDKEKYDRIKVMCDDLMSNGLETLIVTADPEAQKTWSCGSACGTLFLEKWLEIAEKFLKFCVDQSSRGGDDAEAATSVNDDDIDTDKKILTDKASSDLQHTLLERPVSLTKAETKTNSSGLDSNIAAFKRTCKLKSSDSSDNVGKENNHLLDLQLPSEESKTVKDENDSRKETGLSKLKKTTESSGSGEIKVKNYESFAAGVTDSCENDSVDDDDDYDEDGFDDDEDKHQSKVNLKKELTIKKVKDMIECLTDCNFVTIKKDGVDVVWPVDKVYDRSDSDRPFSCKICRKSFGRRHMVIRHVTAVHSSDTPYQCKVCKKLFREKTAIMKHVRIHLAKTHCCHLCGKLFADLNNLKKHYSSHKNYKCSICESKFNNKTAYNEHLKQEHNKMKLKCEECGKLLRDNFSLKRHRITKHTSAKNVKCDVCDKAFKLHENMMLHKRRFHETKFSCEICGVNQPSSYSLKKHVQMVHERRNEMICDICGKGFVYAHRFRIHKRLHDGEYPFKCSYCDKRYTNKESLSHHENTHTREREYMCDICGQKYLQYGHLARHKQLHNKSCRPVKCKYCDACFRAYSAYRSHVFKEHREDEIASGSNMILECQYCGKLFAHPTHLQSHIYRHTGEKPFACEVCGKKFNDKSNLRQHKFTHNKKAWYTCSVCGKTFTQRRTYRSHIKTHDAESLELMDLGNSENQTSNAQSVATVNSALATGHAVNVLKPDEVLPGKTGDNTPPAVTDSDQTMTSFYTVINAGSEVPMGTNSVGKQGDQIVDALSTTAPNIQIKRNVEKDTVHQLAHGQGEMANSTLNTKSLTDGTSGSTEIYIVNVETGGEIQRYKDGGEVPGVVSEYQIQVEGNDLNDGQNYVLVPNADDSTVLIWHSPPTGT